MNKKALLSPREIIKALSRLEKMVEMSRGLLIVYEIISLGKYVEDLKNEETLLGVVITRTDKNPNLLLSHAFASDFCFTAYGFPVYFSGEEECGNANVNWRLKYIDIAGRGRKMAEVLKVIEGKDLLAVIEPMDTETPYFGNLNHFIKNADKRQRISDIISK